MSREQGRVVVGVSGSVAGVCALRRAVLEAGRDHRQVLAVLCWEPPEGDRLYRARPCPELAALWERQATDRWWAAFIDAFGGVPAEVPVERMVVRTDSPGHVLCTLAGDPDDLLVVGTSQRNRPWDVLRPQRVLRYLLRNARCPVLPVSAPQMPKGALGALRRAAPADFAR